MGDPFQSIKTIIFLLQNYWLLTIIVLGWFLRNTIKSWVDSRLTIEVNRFNEAEKEKATHRLEWIKSQYSGELEEAKLRIEIRKAIALELAKQRFEAYKELEIAFGVAGLAVRQFLAYGEPRRSEISTAADVFVKLTAASSVVSERQILLPAKFASDLRELVAFLGSMVIQHRDSGVAASDLVVSSVDLSVKDIKRELRALLEATAIDSMDRAGQQRETPLP